jgi:transposase
MAKVQTFPILHPHAAGIDVGHLRHYVCVGEDPAQDIRDFGCYTDDLVALADWLAARGVTHVAMEATGVYWIPLYELLVSRGFHVIVVDPRQTRRPGRPKSDVLDCQWIRRLHACGFFKGSFRPDDTAYRSYVRRRLTLTKDASRYVLQMQKALDQMNVKLHVAISNVTGKTGLAIIRAIVAGERSPARLARLRDRRCKESEATIARALAGNWRGEHLFALEQALAAWDFCQQQIRACDERLRAALLQMPQKKPASEFPAQPPTSGSSSPNDPPRDLQPLIAAAAGVDLCAIEGISTTIAMVLTSEVGVNVDAFPTEKHLGSWLGLAPKVKGSGKKKRMLAQVGYGARRAAWALRIAASTLHRSQTALGGFFRRLKGRMGAAHAITATAYKIARLVYRMLKHGTAYVQQGLAAYEKQFRDRTLKNLTRKAKSLGFQLVPATEPQAATT